MYINGIFMSTKTLLMVVLLHPGAFHGWLSKARLHFCNFFYQCVTTPRSDAIYLNTLKS